MQPVISTDTAAPKPDGALSIFMYTEGQENPTNIGWIEDLAYLPELLRTVADELTIMMIEQHQRQETERRAQNAG